MIEMIETMNIEVAKPKLDLPDGEYVATKDVPNAVKAPEGGKRTLDKGEVVTVSKGAPSIHLMPIVISEDLIKSLRPLKKVKIDLPDGRYYAARNVPDVVQGNWGIANLYRGDLVIIKNGQPTRNDRLVRVTPAVIKALRPVSLKKIHERPIVKPNNVRVVFDTKKIKAYNELEMQSFLQKLERFMQSWYNGEDTPDSLIKYALEFRHLFLLPKGKVPAYRYTELKADLDIGAIVDVNVIRNRKKLQSWAHKPISHFQDTSTYLLGADIPWDSVVLCPAVFEALRDNRKLFGLNDVCKEYLSEILEVADDLKQEEEILTYVKAFPGGKIRCKVLEIGKHVSANTIQDW